jgi:hypothetical protein
MALASGAMDSARDDYADEGRDEQVQDSFKYDGLRVHGYLWIM